MENIKKLREQFDKSVREIKTDTYSLSVGELINMYKEGDITISPEYQRYFRWNLEQKSSFIESLMLGIPIPSIFVAQDQNGNWDVIDGLQRISTILELVGELENKDPLRLMKTKFLPALENQTWQSIGPNFRRILKRQKISAVIIDSSNNSSIKYELFQRLNTNGSQLSAQEIRNVVTLMANKYLFEKIGKLSDSTNYLTLMDSLSDKKKKTQLDKEMLVESIILVTIDANTINPNQDLDPLLTENLIDNTALATNTQVDNVISKLEKYFTLMSNVLGVDAGKKYNRQKESYTNRFSRPIFEMTLMYVSKNYEKLVHNSDKLVIYHKNLPINELFKLITRNGFRPADRIKQIISKVN